MASPPARARPGGESGRERGGLITMRSLVHVGVLALMASAPCSLAFHLPQSALRAPGWTSRAGALAPRGARPGAHVALRMSFVPDKDAIKQNFAKVPDHLILRDPVKLRDDTTKETVEIYSTGACLTSYVTGAGYDVLFRRPDAVYDGSKPISGGVPICWPQFGPGAIQQHGFARNLKWECVDVREETAGGPNQGSWLVDKNKAVFEIMDTAETRKMWDRKFKVRYEVVLDAGAVTLQLRVQNKGWQPLEFTCALHTYFAVDDIDKCSISGLQAKK